MKQHVTKERGFTLIEIIAVLIILGILAAVAVPRYMGMQETAQEKDVLYAVGAANDNFTLALGKYLEEEQTMPNTIAQLVASGGLETDLGDFTVSYSAASTGELTITVVGSDFDWFDNDGISSESYVSKVFPSQGVTANN